MKLHKGVSSLIQNALWLYTLVHSGCSAPVWKCTWTSMCYSLFCNKNKHDAIPISMSMGFCFLPDRIPEKTPSTLVSFSSPSSSSGSRQCVLGRLSCWTHCRCTDMFYWAHLTMWLAVFSCGALLLSHRRDGTASGAFSVLCSVSFISILISESHTGLVLLM